MVAQMQTILVVVVVEQPLQVVVKMEVQEHLIQLQGQIQHMLVVVEVLQEHHLQQLVLVVLEVEVQEHQHQQILVLLELQTQVVVEVEQVILQQVLLQPQLQEQVDQEL
jgi:hypothetical protein